MRRTEKHENEWQEQVSRNNKKQQQQNQLTTSHGVSFGSGRESQVSKSSDHANTVNLSDRGAGIALDVGQKHGDRVNQIEGKLPVYVF